MGSRGPWLVAGGAVVLAVAIVTGALIITADRQTSATPAAAAVATGPTTSSWPPPLPPGVPTTGANAWRATWTPDPNAEQQYMASLLGTDAGAFDFGAGYVPGNSTKLIRFGYAVCEDYYRGVSGSDESDHVIQQLVDDPAFKPGITNGGQYGNVRTGAATMAALTLTLAANTHLCMNVDPWGETY